MNFMEMIWLDILAGLLKEAEKWKFQNLEAKKSALLWLKGRNFSETWLISAK